MTYIPNGGAVISGQTLAADWANAGVVSFSYPSGFTQGSFINGLAVPNGSYIIKNQNDQVVEDVSAAAGVLFTFGASTVSVTNNTGATIVAGTRLDIFLDQVDGNAVETFAFPIYLPACTSSSTVVSAFRPGCDGNLENVEWHQRVSASTAAKAASLAPYINGVVVSGGVVALTTALAVTGATVQGTQITAARRITKKDSLSISCTTATTFVEGDGTLYVRVRKDSL